MPFAFCRQVVAPALLLISLVILPQTLPAQHTPWQQFVTYDMDVRLDVNTHRMNGTQQLVYHNNSPDTLRRLYYHLYFNAFQPNSMMDVRSRSIADPDARVRDRIYYLNNSEIGYQKIESLTQDGSPVRWSVSETVLIVYLNTPILPGQTTTMDMVFESQVPLQIRRSGRDSREGIAYSMTQWYPRIAGYDQEGWATSPYVAREFHGTFGDFNVRITIDSSYTIGGTGYLQNPQEIGKGYEAPGSTVQRPSGRELTWHFHAPNVIDFAWAADDRYTHEIYDVPNGPRLHLLYVKQPQTRHWANLGEYTARAVEFLNEYLGPYPYEQFTILQGGDGGMEYPMATLITGHRNLRSLVGVTVHELLHMWFQTVLATNESRYHFMDEGYTVYMSNLTMAHLFGERGLPHYGNYIGYLNVVYSGIEEPMITHADRFETNAAYSMASYTKGAILLHQLGYIIGEEALKRTLQRYYREWQFRHPNPTDFRRAAEQESGMILDWYFDQWINTTHTIDYAIDDVSHNDDQLKVILKRKGKAIMPLDLFVVYNDGTREIIHIPQQLSLGAKPGDPQWYGATPFSVESPWRWTDDTYEVSIYRPGREVEEVTIDPTYRLADLNRLNNKWPFPRDVQFAQPLVGRWDTYTASWRPSLWYGQNSGLHLGVSAQGTYIFGLNRTEASLQLTTGPTDDIGLKSLDADYHFTTNHRLKSFGNNASVDVTFRRFYGIGEESLTFNKRLTGYRVPQHEERNLSFRLFHQYYHRQRNINALHTDWERSSILGMHLQYEVGDASTRGIAYNFVSGSTGRLFSASYLTVQANHTWYYGVNFRTRVGAGVGAGSDLMPRHWLWALSGPTTENLWRNHAYWGVANLDDSIIPDFNLLANDGVGLLGYGLPNIGSPDRPGNNYFTGTIWNTWQPFAAHSTLRLLELELFGGLGKSWSGAYIGDFPEFGSANPLLASLGTGVVFDAGSLPVFNRWRPQSKFLQELQVSVRMPFWLNGLQGHDDIGARFVIGISEKF